MMLLLFSLLLLPARYELQQPSLEPNAPLQNTQPSLLVLFYFSVSSPVPKEVPAGCVWPGAPKRPPPAAGCCCCCCCEPKSPWPVVEAPKGDVLPNIVNTRSSCCCYCCWSGAVFRVAVAAAVDAAVLLLLLLPQCCCCCTGDPN